MQLSLNSESRLPLVDQIVSAIRNLIDDRVLRPAMRLPPIRRFAETHAVSRFTAVEAYDRLVALGYLQSRRGSGFYVAARPDAAVQAKRVRADVDVFALFQWALVSNFGDEAFSHAMQVAIARFGLRDLFETQTAQPLDQAVHELSLHVGLQLLDVIDRIFVLSGVAEGQFQVGGPVPEEHYHVPAVCVSMLADSHRALWTLPDAPLPDVLAALSETCGKILRPV